jgi:hypothetical protein
MGNAFGIVSHVANKKEVALEFTQISKEEIP